MQHPQEHRKILHQMVQTQKKPGRRNPWKPGGMRKAQIYLQRAKEYETIEADIEKLENRLSEIDDEMVKNATNFGKLNELTKEKKTSRGS